MMLLVIMVQTFMPCLRFGSTQVPHVRDILIHIPFVSGVWAITLCNWRIVLEGIYRFEAYFPRHPVIVNFWWDSCSNLLWPCRTSHGGCDT